MRKYALILLILMFIGVGFLQAATTGKLAVRVRDNSGRPIGFVNIVVMQGNQRITGGQTNEKGTVIIINIPPGVYTVKFSLIGYDTMTFNDVRIQVDQTTSLSPIMNKSGIEMKAVTVTAKEDKVDKNRIGSAKNIQMDIMTDAAVSDVTDIVALQPGVSNIGGELHIRGGRANEVNYTVDGMSVTDPVDGGATLQVDTDAIKDMKVMTGGFPAEYGNAQSGVINIVTKDGDPFYSGKVEYNNDHLFLESRNSDVLKVAIGGPVIPFSSQEMREKFTYYLNGSGEWLDGRLKDYYVSNPNIDYSIKGRSLLDTEYDVYDPYADRDNILGIDIGNRNYNAYNVNLKTKYAFKPGQIATFAVRGDRSLNYLYDNSWRYALQHYAEEETTQRQYIGTYDDVINDRMNLKIKASYYQKDSYQGPRGIDRNNYMYMTIDPNNIPENYVDMVSLGNYGYTSIDADNDNVLDEGFLPASYWVYRLESVEEPRNIPGYNPPGTIYGRFIDDTTDILSARADFEWQINDTHMAKTGLEIIKHNIKKNQLENYLKIDDKRRTNYLNSIFDVRDYDLADYIDANEDLICDNVPEGLYALAATQTVPTSLADLVPIYYPQDYFAAAKASAGTRDGYKAEPWQMAYYLQDKMEWEGMIVNAGLRFDLWYLGKNYSVAQDDGSYSVREFDKDDQIQLMISPRLGVSHPITDKDVLRFAYNYQNQLPQMQYIFTSKTPEDANDAETTIQVGNPSLEPQITVTYEVGLSHQLSDDYVLDLTAYYKNLYNYVSTMKERSEIEQTVYWYKYYSNDYGSARGIDMQLEKMLSNFNTWSIAYSLAWAQGNNSYTVIQDESTNLREFPLDWDVRHNISANYTFHIARGEEYFIPFTDYILPLDDFSANVTWTFASGAPYTPQSTESSSALDTNSKRKDFTQQTDMRITKGFVLSNKMSFKVYAEVENLFKNLNVYTVYPKTGNYYWGGDNLEEANIPGFVYDEVNYVYGLAYKNPTYYNNFRSLTLGISFNF
ncbi:MAG: carboxypeptidase regulatory-like domain-containing protein [Candidatus Cloacimonas sp.]